MTFRLQGDRYSHFEIRLLDDAVLWIPESEKIKVSHQNPKSQLLRIGGDHPKVSHLITLRRLKHSPLTHHHSSVSPYFIFTPMALS
ncbi:MAG: hypothetical protein L3J39_02625 [Verrucomicrobiales bacterium]|nr:hypothetical protein [Verrucomicrobiales bacterium]